MVVNCVTIGVQRDGGGRITTVIIREASFYNPSLLCIIVQVVKDP